MRTRRPLLAFLFVATAAGPAAAQVIPIQTVPIARGERRLLFPSDHLGMGSVSIALADSVLDPFRNPAFGGRVAAAHLFAAPALYGTSRNTGGGRTLPLAAVARAGPWYGAVALAVQQVDASRPVPTNVIFATPIAVDPVPTVSFTDPGDRTHGNRYGFASLGRVFPRQGLSLGGSVLWSGVHAQDGADLLYPGSVRFTESGRGTDLRLGLSKEWVGNRSVEALVMRRALDVRHEAVYADVFWDPGTQSFQQVARVDAGRDRAVTWGVHFAYQRPLGAAGWRIGWVATANRVTEPILASSEVVTIPGGEGRATALNVGVGVSRRNGPAVYGMDLVYEPIWSSSWTVAASPVETSAGDTIPLGGRALENQFRFSNLMLRMGLSRDIPLPNLDRALAFQLGLVVHPISYRLHQADPVALVTSRMHEHWVEWSPTWGLRLRFPEFDLHYQGRVLNGLGRPGTFIDFPVRINAGGVFAVATGTLDLTGVTTVTHQISVSLPLR
jgi:hypothetical protein